MKSMGKGVPEWPAYRADTGYMRMRLDVQSKAELAQDRAAYKVLNMIFAKGQLDPQATDPPRDKFSLAVSSKKFSSAIANTIRVARSRSVATRSD